MLSLEKRGMSECYIIIIIILSALLHDIHTDAVSFRPVPILNSAKFINIGQTAYERFICHPIVYFTAYRRVAHASSVSVVLASLPQSGPSQIRG